MKKSIIVVRLYGGLGNQLFGYASARALAIKMDAILLIDKSIYRSYTLHKYCLDKYNISIGGYIDSSLTSRIVGFVTRKLARYGLTTVVSDEDNGQVEGRTRGSFLVLMDGYFQDSSLFEESRDVLLRELRVRVSLTEKTRSLASFIESTNCIALHIRRGDYVSNRKAYMTHGVCREQYYKLAMSRIRMTQPDARIVVFSDDIQWCEENIGDLVDCPKDEVLFIRHTTSDTNYEDILMMSLCNHNIIANSTFSWWGAWLGAYEQKTVIAPKRWFAGEERADESPCLEEWIKI